MCGIAGIFLFRQDWSNDRLQGVIDVMTDSLLHRGPDSRGTWIKAETGIGLGHRRLAIRDLTEAGHQPMISSCGRYVIIYNGEVYSHTEISRDLRKKGRRFIGTSDTEIILEACSEWGIEATLERMIGMFALAIYDNRENELILARDRLGIKPLYWGIVDRKLIFASELKSLRTLKEWAPVIDRNALASFMRHNYIPAPHSIYKNFYKLEPGSLLRVRSDGIPRKAKFWDLNKIVVENIKSPSQLPEEELLQELDELLCDAVRRRMVSDVPLGALLSGGIDSSLVTALMAEQSDRAIHTFTIGFNEKDFDEASYAREIAAHLNTEHTEMYVEAEDAMNLVEKLPYWYDEPFADSSQLPTMLVSELTKRHVTVALTGDGGDELFGGYNRYTLGLDMWKRANFAPFFARKIIAYGLLKQPVNRLDSLAKLLPAFLCRPQMGSKLHKFANAILLEDPDSMYLRMLSHWVEPDRLVQGASEYKGVLWDKTLVDTVPDFLDRMQLLDTLTYLPDDILTKVDRASMSVSLEARVPLLDHRVVEQAWSLPRDMKIRGGTGKWALRQILYKRIPRRLIDRPKMGFGVPFDKWLRGPLKSWALSLINTSRLEKQGLFDANQITQKWNAHLNGENWGYPLWNVLMAQAWIESNPDVSI